MTQNADYVRQEWPIDGGRLGHLRDEDDFIHTQRHVPLTADSVRVTGIWLRRNGDEAEVLAEVAGEWLLVITELLDGQFSHIVEPGGIRRAVADALTADGEAMGEYTPPNDSSGAS